MAESEFAKVKRIFNLSMPQKEIRLFESQSRFKMICQESNWGSPRCSSHQGCPSRCQPIRRVLQSIRLNLQRNRLPKPHTKQGLSAQVIDRKPFMKARPSGIEPETCGLEVVQNIAKNLLFSRVLISQVAQGDLRGAYQNVSICWLYVWFCSEGSQKKTWYRRYDIKSITADGCQDAG